MTAPRLTGLVARLRRPLVVAAILVAMGGFAYGWDWVANGRAPAIAPALGHTMPAADDELARWRSPSVGRVLLRLARAALHGTPAADDGVLRGLPGRRMFVCRYTGGAPGLCGTGLGATPGEAVQAAVADLLTRTTAPFDPPSQDAARAERLKVDVVIAAEAARFSGTIDDPDPGEIGLAGVWLARDGQTAWAVPSEILERGVSKTGDDVPVPGVARDDLLALLRERAPSLSEPGRRFGYRRLRTIAFVEGPNDDVLPVARVHVDRLPAIDADDLLQRTVWASGYLMSATDDAGRVRYHADVAGGRDSSDYNWLRHAGSVWAMLRAYQRTHWPALRLAAERALEAFVARCRRGPRQGPFGGGDTMFLVDGGSIPLGGPALGLLMLAAHTEATGERGKHLDDARALGRFIVSQQKTTGEFDVFAAEDPAGPSPGGTSPYYVGEALLALTRLHGIDPDKAWLDVAERGATYLIEHRDAGVADADLPNDHWFMMALGDLATITRNPKYVDHALRLAAGVRIQQARNAGKVRAFPDYAGGYYDPPRSTPAATRAEGLVGVLDACRAVNRACDWVMALLQTTVQHQLQSQYTPDQIWWPVDRGRAFGGFAGGITDTSIRNDFVQHNLCAMLGLERWLRSPQGQPPEPLDTDKLRRLHASSTALRGLTRWEQ